MRLWSRKKRQLSWICIVLGVFLTGCQISSKKEASSASQNENKPLVDEKYSLTADRQALDVLRKDIPPEKKKENDELAFMQQLFADESKTPSSVRDKFDSLLSKKRELFQKDMTHIRETYSRDEKKHRDEFSKEQEEARAEFQKKKSTSQERTDFYSDLEGKRKDYYSDEREKRDEFESDMRDKRKNFEDYTREKSDEFNQMYRSYSKRYEEAQKLKESQSEK